MTHIAIGSLTLNDTPGIEKALAAGVVILLTIYGFKHKRRKMLLVLWSFVAGWLAGQIIIHNSVSAAWHITEQIWGAITGVFR